MELGSRSWLSALPKNCCSLSRQPKAAVSPIDHPEEFLELLDSPGLASLGPDPRPGTLEIAGLTQQARLACSQSQIKGERQELVLGALLLWHDHPDAAHEIAQQIDGPDGGLLHAIVHRREPDYSNAKYWLRNAGRHACYVSLAAAVAKLSPGSEAGLIAKILPGAKWDPFAFVDACASLAQHPEARDRRKLLQDIQRLETASFISHCGLSPTAHKSQSTGDHG